ncbi:MAG: hypothetical protein AB1394_14060 [Bacteroidota bacterium]
MQETFLGHTTGKSETLMPPEEKYNLDETVEELKKYIEQPHSLKKLAYYSLKHIRLYFYCDTIRTATANDVVNEVITKVITGKRKWDKKKFPKIDYFLRIAILSYIRNEAKRKDITSRSQTINDDKYDWEADPYYTRKCIEEDYKNKLFANETNLLIDRFIKEFEKDNLVVKILKLYLTGVESQIEIAQKLNVDIKEIYKALKRIRRKKKLAEQLFFEK